MSDNTYTVVMVVIICSLLGACGHAPEPKIETQIVYVDRPVSCVPKDTPTAPTYSDTAEALKRSTPDRGFFLMSSEWPRRDARLRLTEKLVAACRD